MNKLQIKRSLILTAISVIVSFIAFLKISRHGNIKVIEILITITLGMGISALIFNAAQFYNIKKKNRNDNLC